MATWNDERFSVRWNDGSLALDNEEDLPWIFGDQSPDQVFRLLRDVLEEIVGEVEPAAAYVTKGLLLSIAAKRRASCQ